MGCSFVAKLPSFSQALLDWTKILAFFFFPACVFFLWTLVFVLLCFFVCLFLLNDRG